MSQLQRFIDRKTEELGLISPGSTEGLEDVIDNPELPFWIWDHDHSNLLVDPDSKCCYMHIVGLPKVKDETTGLIRDNPLMPYQRSVLEALEQYRRIAVLKARGIGMTTLVLYYLGYLILTGRLGKNNRACIVTGPRIDLAIDLLSRFVSLFNNVSPKLFNDNNSKAVECVLNSVKVTCFPSHSISSMRGLTGVRFIMGDEMAFYPPFMAKESRQVIEGYCGKRNSDPSIILISTANSPLDMMQQIRNESNSIYHFLTFDYKFGLEGPYPIFTRSQIQTAKRSRTFAQEYRLIAEGISGNVFAASGIDFAVSKKFYNPDQVISSTVSLGVDPSFTGFGIVGVRMVNNYLQVIIAEQHEREKALIPAMINRISEIHEKHNISFCYVDAAAPECWAQLKRDVFEEPYSDAHMDYYRDVCKKYNHEFDRYMKVCPVAFSTHGDKMLQHAVYLMDRKKVLIDKKFDKLITGLRTCSVTTGYKMDKTATLFDDIIDAFRLALQPFHWEKKGE